MLWYTIIKYVTIKFLSLTSTLVSQPKCCFFHLHQYTFIQKCSNYNDVFRIVIEVQRQRQRHRGATGHRNAVLRNPIAVAVAMGKLSPRPRTPLDLPCQVGLISFLWHKLRHYRWRLKHKRCLARRAISDDDGDGMIVSVHKVIKVTAEEAKECLERWTKWREIQREIF